MSNGRDFGECPRIWLDLQSGDPTGLTEERVREIVAEMLAERDARSEQIVVEALRNATKRNGRIVPA